MASGATSGLESLEETGLERPVTRGSLSPADARHRCRMEPSDAGIIRACDQSGVPFQSHGMDYEARGASEDGLAFRVLHPVKVAAAFSFAHSRRDRVVGASHDERSVFDSHEFEQVDVAAEVPTCGERDGSGATQRIPLPNSTLDRCARAAFVRETTIPGAASDSASKAPAPVRSSGSSRPSGNRTPTAPIANDCGAAAREGWAAERGCQPRGRSRGQSS